MADIPIAKLRKDRQLPQYSVKFTSDAFSRYQDEIPPNHLDLPADKLPKNGKEMKVIMDQQSHWLKARKQRNTQQ